MTQHLLIPISQKYIHLHIFINQEQLNYQSLLQQYHTHHLHQFIHYLVLGQAHFEYAIYCLKLLMNFKTAPAFTLPKSLKKTIVDMSSHNPIVPGPVYDLPGLGHKQSSVSHSIGKSKRQEINHRIEETPSPMHYQPPSLHSGPHKTIPKSSFTTAANLNPDPACYITDQKHTTSKVLAYTLTYRSPSIMEETNRNPGPADYQSPQPPPILSHSKNSKQTHFGTGSRFVQQASHNNPGAAHYSLPSSRQDQKYSIGKANRTPHIESTPGPSDYHKMSFVEESIKGKLGKSITGKIKSSLLNEMTTINAFHKYLQNPESQFIGFKTNPKYSLGKQKRQFLKLNPNPGPTQYINNDFLVKHSSAALIPRSDNAEYSDSAFKPGPGTYQVEGRKGLQYSFPKSKSVASIGSSAPGVGRYQLQALKSRKGPAFPKSSRFEKEQKLGAGVGQYDLQVKSELKGSISRSERFKQQIFSTPGPGDYHVHSLIGYKSVLDKP